MIQVNVTARAADEDDIAHDHDGECRTDARARSVCEGIYLDRLNDNLELCAALRAAYAVAGEDPQVRTIVEEALDQHGA